VRKGKPTNVAPPARGWAIANFMKYDSKDFLEQCVEKNPKLSESKVIFQKVDSMSILLKSFFAKLLKRFCEFWIN
jgi:hypothetical protein